jgi:CopG-like RHH_1 or ribbon-helix-helix domain, RHH_5
MAAKRVHFQLDEDLIARAQQAADDDRRTLSNWIAVVVERALEDRPPWKTGPVSRPGEPAP